MSGREGVSRGPVYISWTLKGKTEARADVYFKGHVLPATAVTPGYLGHTLGIPTWTERGIMVSWPSLLCT